MLMHDFYAQINVSKQIVHFQKFMQEIHNKLHKLKDISEKKIIKQLAQDISKKHHLLCIDEFEINDISDAMIIMHLFEHLRQNDTTIFLTTNTKPNNLYKDGIQRDSFLPFIDFVCNNFHNLDLDSPTDYRYNMIQDQQRIFMPSDDHSLKEIETIKNNLSLEKTLGERKSELLGRFISFKTATNNTVFTNFNELFQRNLGYNDYVHLTQHYEIFIVENIRKIKDSETDIITRFINFIDNAYYNKALLFLTSDYSIDEIYESGPKIKEFQRTISRIYEMNTKKYTPRIEN